MVDCRKSARSAPAHRQIDPAVRQGGGQRLAVVRLGGAGDGPALGVLQPGVAALQHQPWIEQRQPQGGALQALVGAAQLARQRGGQAFGQALQARALGRLRCRQAAAGAPPASASGPARAPGAAPGRAAAAAAVAPAAPARPPPPATGAPGGRSASPGAAPRRRAGDAAHAAGVRPAPAARPATAPAARSPVRPPPWVWAPAGRPRSRRW